MQTLGTAALTVIQGGMASSTPATKQPLHKPSILLPQTIEEASSLQAWAEATNDQPVPAAPVQITKHLTFMAATLPSRATDQATGKMRFAVYSALLAEFSNDALAFMARKACATLDWFPTPRQCLDILNQYRPPVSEHDQALRLCHNFWQGRFEEWMALIQAGTAAQDLIDQAPKQWRMIAMEKGHLRLMQDDKFVLRRAAMIAAA